jgi:peptidoglycan hydrolase CwlO-like protein
VLAQAPPPAGAFEDVQNTLAAILSAIENLQTDVDKLTDDVDSLSTDVSNLQTDVDKPYWNK